MHVMSRASQYPVMDVLVDAEKAFDCGMKICVIYISPVWFWTTFL